MKSFLFSLFISIFYLQISTAQGTQGSAVYKLDVLPQNHFEDLKETNPDQYRRFVATAKRFESEIEQLNFSLLFKGVESSYQTEDFLNTAPGSANSFGRAKGIFYNNQQTRERLQQVERNGKVFTIKKGELSWKITSEEKPIGEFTARKAITYVDNFNNQQNSDHKEEVVAWFTSAVPVQFGPEGFGGLPGLILELQMAGGRYYLDKLYLNLENILVEKPKEQNLVTFHEYQEMMRDLSERYKKFHNLN